MAIEDAYFWYNKGAGFYIVGKYREAIEAYEKAIEFNPNYFDAWYNKGLALSNLGRHEEELKAYEKAIEFNPNYFDAWYNKGFVLSDLGRHEEALKAYKKAIEIKPDDSKTWCNIGLALSDLGRHEEALKAYKKAIGFDNKNPYAHNNYANALRKRKQYSEAEREVRAALQIYPSDPSFLGTLGDILADEEAFKEAEEAYLEALDNLQNMDPPRISEIYNNLGWVFVKTKQYDRAIYCFKEAISYDSLNIKARRNLRVIEKLETQSDCYKKQLILGFVVGLSIVGLYYFFWIEKISETVFATQLIVLIALLIFIIMYPDLGKFKVAGIEIEKSSDYKYVGPRRQFTENSSEIER